MLNAVHRHLSMDFYIIDNIAWMDLDSDSENIY